MNINENIRYFKLRVSCQQNTENVCASEYKNMNAYKKWSFNRRYHNDQSGLQQKPALSKGYPAITNL